MGKSIKMQRNRLLFSALTLLVLVVGLNSRSGFIAPNSFLGRYSGDTLWALMIYLGTATLFPKTPVRHLVLGSSAFSLLIEVSQLFKFNWLMVLRSYKLGGLILGYGFLWSDLLCYMTGIAIGAIVDKLVQSQTGGAADADI